MERDREDAAADRVLIVPRAVLAATHAFFLPYWRAGVETACFWSGVEAGAGQVVTTLATPRLLHGRRHYRIDPGSMRRLAADLESQDLVNLAQVHTHPVAWVGHSPYDDSHAYSTAEGALSLVWPRFGFTHHHLLAGVGVHERRRGNWVQLATGEVAQRVRLVDSHLDCRWEIARVPEEDETGEDIDHDDH